MRKVLIVFIISIFFAAPTCAQEFSGDKIEEAAMLAESFGLDPNGFHMRRYLQTNSELAEETSNSKVVKHLRFNKGDPFPDFNIWKQKILAEVKASYESGDSSWPGYTEPGSMIVPRIPPCIENKTIVANLSKDSSHKNVVSFDHIFIRDTSPMLDVAKVFGPEIKVSPVTDDSDTPQALAASGLGVTCLPTRYRSVDGNLYKLEGEAALKNYSESLKGNLHEDVAQRLSSFF